MSTTDNNGLPFFTTSDNVTSLASLLNAISTGASNAFDARTPIYPVANTTARSALVSSLGWTPSTTRPLYAHRADATSGRELERTTNGTTWTTVGAMIPAIPGATMILVTATVTTNANGDASISLGAGFATSLDAALLQDSRTSTDTATGSFTIRWLPTLSTKSSVAFRLLASSGAVAGLTTQITVLAIGH